ncbi:glycosyltransferase [Pygmaiobacter massiliensis]|uniref:glycosyltransferase n=1 Tax=Pygmaiobacter massiliensis TaxID=1917873 RepID=UPI002897A49E|nr:glycosyltransferase [Pygmaiobacter massiliensis]
MNHTPKVAVWLIVPQHESQLDITIKSVLQQTFKNFKLYLAAEVDDKEHWDMVCGYAALDKRVQIVRWQSASGTESLKNVVFRLEEDYIAFLECGNSWQKDKLEKQVAFLYANPDFGACFTGLAFSSGDDVIPMWQFSSRYTRIERLRDFLCGTTELGTNSALIRREMYCHPNFFGTQAFELPMPLHWVRLCEKAEVGVLAETLTCVCGPRDKKGEIRPPLTVILKELSRNLSDTEFAAIFADDSGEKKASMPTRLELVKSFFETRPESPYASELRDFEPAIAQLLEQKQSNIQPAVPTPSKVPEKDHVLKQIEIALYLQPYATEEKEQCIKQNVSVDLSGSFHAVFHLPQAHSGLVRIGAGSLPYTVEGISLKDDSGKSLAFTPATEKRDQNGRLTFWSKAPQFSLPGISVYTKAIHVMGCVEVLLGNLCEELTEAQRQINRELEARKEAEKGLGKKEEYIRNCERLIADQQRHIAELERTQAQIVNSFFWRVTWPARASVSFVKKFFSTAPGLRIAYRVAACLKDNGWAFTKEMCKDDLYYRHRFPGKTMPACRFENRTFLRKQASAAVQGPTISILVPLYNTPLNYLQEMVDSVRNQTYPNWELCLADAGLGNESAAYLRKMRKKEPRIRVKKLAQNLGISGNTNAAMEVATGDYFALLDHDDLLHPSALWYMVKEIADGADFVYTDELTFEGDILNVKNYAFKPDFAPEMLLSCNYICHFSAFSRALLAKAGGGFRSEYDGSQDYDMVLRLTEQADKIAHVPHALYYWRASATSVASDISAKQYCIDAAIAALQAHLERMHLAGKVSLIPKTPGFYKIDYALTAQPLISIIIPSCDHIADLDKCICSICEKTSYKNYEILIVENNSRNKETFAYYEDLSGRTDVQVLYYLENEPFNYSKLNNFGVKYAKGEVLLLLNNDVEILSERWLEEMLMYVQQPEIGAVGAMLYYPDDTVQHAGVGIGIGGIAGHLHKYFSRDSHGYMGRMHYAQNVGAVTGACLMLRRKVYEQLHGLNEEFAVAFNDVDLCMRIRRAGYRIVLTPHAKLYHYESKSRGGETTPEKQKRFLGEIKLFEEYWQRELDQGDPFYNINLSLYSEQFELAVQPLSDV